MREGVFAEEGCPSSDANEERPHSRQEKVLRVRRALARAARRGNRRKRSPSGSALPEYLGWNSPRPGSRTHRRGHRSHYPPLISQEERHLVAPMNNSHHPLLKGFPPPQPLWRWRYADKGYRTGRRGFARPPWRTETPSRRSRSGDASLMMDGDYPYS